MTGTLQMTDTTGAKHDISGANNVTAQGVNTQTLTTNTATLPSGQNLTLGTSTVGNTGNNTITQQSGSLVSQTSTGAAAPMQASSFVDGNNNTYQVTPSGTSNLNVVNAVTVGATGSMSSPIYYDSADHTYYIQASGTSYMSQLNIQDATIRSKSNHKLSDLLSPIVFQSILNVSNGGIVTKPTCASGGTPALVMWGTSTYTNDGTTNVTADDLGGSWRTNIYMGSGAAAGAGQGQAMTACYYP
jgi:hypothetical protein